MDESMGIILVKLDFWQVKGFASSHPIIATHGSLIVG